MIIPGLPKDRNLLVVYKGGGYSGCFWEWNAFYLTNRGSFRSIIASGSAGIKCEKDAQHAFSSQERIYDLDPYFVDLENEDEILAFSSEFNGEFSLKVLGWLQDAETRYKISAKCVFCEEAHNVFECYGARPGSDGGLVVSSRDIACLGCVSERICSECGEVYDSVLEYDEDYGDILCRWCKDWTQSSCCEDKIPTQEETAEYLEGREETLVAEEAVER